MKEGNSWTYRSYGSTAGSAVDTTATNSATLSIFRTNTLIGGQAQAFIANVTSLGYENHLAFYIDDKTLWNYLGYNNTYSGQSNDLVWIEGGGAPALVEANGTVHFHIVDRNAGTYSYAIRQRPNVSVASAVMVSPDTVEITGHAIGQTLFTLGRVGGATADTMSVFVDVVETLPSPFVFPSPWIPIWQLTASTSGETIFSRDTVYSFRRVSDSVLCTDRLSYLLTNRYVGRDTVAALNTHLACDHFVSNWTVMETISDDDGTFTRILFSGLTSQYTADLWLARGLGFVKGVTRGTTKIPVATMAGRKDSSGRLYGLYISPRVRYAYAEVSPGTSAQYFNVDLSPLNPDGDQGSFILSEKNF